MSGLYQFLQQCRDTRHEESFEGSLNKKSYSMFLKRKAWCLVGAWLNGALCLICMGLIVARVSPNSTFLSFTPIFFMNLMCLLALSEMCASKAQETKDLFFDFKLAGAKELIKKQDLLREFLNEVFLDRTLPNKYSQEQTYEPIIEVMQSSSTSQEEVLAQFLEEYWADKVNAQKPHTAKPSLTREYLSLDGTKSDGHDVQPAKHVIEPFTLSELMLGENKLRAKVMQHNAGAPRGQAFV